MPTTPDEIRALIDRLDSAVGDALDDTNGVDVEGVKELVEAGTAASNLLGRVAGESLGATTLNDKIAVQAQVIEDLRELLRGIIKADDEDDDDTREELLEQAEHKLANLEEVVPPAAA